jgi:hypothetical protein
MDSGYGPLFASYVAKTIFRFVLAAFIVGIASGALLVWIFS